MNLDISWLKITFIATAKTGVLRRWHVSLKHLEPVLQRLYSVADAKESWDKTALSYVLELPSILTYELEGVPNHISMEDQDVDFLVSSHGCESSRKSINETNTNWRTGMGIYCFWNLARDQRWKWVCVPRRPCALPLQIPCHFQSSVSQ